MTNEQNDIETQATAEVDPTVASADPAADAVQTEVQPDAKREETVAEEPAAEESAGSEEPAEETTVKKPARPKKGLDGISMDRLLDAVLNIQDVKVDRKAFLTDRFRDFSSIMDTILSEGPAKAGISRETLNKLAEKLIGERTGSSSLTAFSLGFPGILAKREGVPADMLTLLSVLVRLCQELAYLYGAEDFWKRDEVHAKGRLKLFLAGAMNVPGGDSGVRVVMAPYAATGIEEIPRDANNHAIWKKYTGLMERSVMLELGKSHNLKDALTALPILGGVLNGGFHMAGLLPMANRLHHLIDYACFDYTTSAFNQDFVEMETFEFNSYVPEEDWNGEPKNVVKTIGKGTRLAGSTGAGLVGKAITKGGMGMARGGSGIVGLLGSVVAGAAMSGAKGKGKGMGGGGGRGGHGSSSSAIGDLSSTLLNSAKKETKPEVQPEVKKEEESMNEIIEALQKLKQLKDEEVITEEEFMEKRKELLARI